MEARQHAGPAQLLSGLCCRHFASLAGYGINEYSQASNHAVAFKEKKRMGRLRGVGLYGPGQKLRA
ncbi:hypothetical protein GCM10023188_01250 [Pontibacter saemangeumensis]|uniref:Uncharacterized protein n=1 Tax=Pontibacter saemangeumensis TaxID=1084525 RepID=A0ABP8L748_9BACT